MSNFNSQQKNAIESSSKALLIIAGAGTGKTHTLIGRVIYLLEKGVKPSSICAITFTNKAAKEMRDRLLPILKSDRQRTREWFSLTQPFIGTFHSLGARILRKETPLLGRSKNFIIFDEQDSLSLLKKIIKERGWYKTISPAESKRTISSLKNKSTTLFQVDNFWGQKKDVFRELYVRYEELLQSHNAFDFDDLLFVSQKHLSKNSQALLFYQSHFQHYLVDEYQDINTIQYELLKTLIPSSGTLGVVGDENQTIYSWRGSNIKTFLDFPEYWKEAEVVILNQHYRSTKTIIEAASSLIKNNQQQLYPEERRLVTSNNEGEEIVLHEAFHEEGEGEWVVDKIYKEKVKNKEVNIAVLYRTNAQSRAIEQALIEANIPYIVFGGVRFYERKEVRDVMAALRYFHNRRDEVSKERLEKTFTKRRWRELEPRISQIPLSQPKVFLEKFLEISGYYDYLYKNFTNAEERKENIEELLDFSLRFEAIDDFLEEVTLLQSTDSLEEKSDVSPIVLSTIHLAKGLEFEVVFIVGCTEGILPHIRSLTDDNQLEEERRLLYVAMTRAKDKLYLSFYKIPSRFLAELPEKKINFESALSGKRLDWDNEERYITID